MSDAKLRELERRWKETGALADEAAYLRALVARGELSPTRLNLAAWVGAPAARAAAGLPAGPGSDARGLRALADGVSRVLGALRHEEMVAFAAACVRPHLAALEPLVPGTAAFLHAVDVWLACPCDDHRPVAVAGALVDPRPPVGAGLVAAARLLHVVELLECRRLVVTDDRAEQEAVFGRFLEDCVHDGLRESTARDVTAWALGRARPAPPPRPEAMRWRGPWLDWPPAVDVWLVAKPGGGMKELADLRQQLELPWGAQLLKAASQAIPACLINGASLTRVAPIALAHTCLSLSPPDQPDDRLDLSHWALSTWTAFTPIPGP